MALKKEEATVEISQQQKANKRRGAHEKGADGTAGTEAQNRFEIDSLPKSLYHLDGKPLEVDTD